jgi:hypothetical protein
MLPRSRARLLRYCCIMGSGRCRYPGKSPVRERKHCEIDATHYGAVAGHDCYRRRNSNDSRPDCSPDTSDRCRQTEQANHCPNRPRPIDEGFDDGDEFSHGAPGSDFTPASDTCPSMGAHRPSAAARARAAARVHRGRAVRDPSPVPRTRWCREPAPGSFGAQPRCPLEKRTRRRRKPDSNLVPFRQRAALTAATSVRIR